MTAAQPGLCGTGIDHAIVEQFIIVTHLSPAERRAAMAAPVDGFVSRRVAAAGHEPHLRRRVTADVATPCLLLHELAVSIAA